MIDGAGVFRKFWNITLPSISGMFSLMLVMQIIGVFQVMYEPLTMTDGGPNNASISLMLTSYFYGFRFYQAGRAAAVGTITFLFLIGLTILYFYLQRRTTTDERRERTVSEMVQSKFSKQKDAQATGIISKFDMKNPSVKVLYGVIWFFMILAVLLCFLPPLWCMTSALKDSREFFSVPATLIPRSSTRKSCGRPGRCSTSARPTSTRSSCCAVR